MTKGTIKAGTGKIQNKRRHRHDNGRDMGNTEMNDAKIKLQFSYPHQWWPIIWHRLLLHTTTRVYHTLCCTWSQTADLMKWWFIIEEREPITEMTTEQSDKYLLLWLHCLNFRFLLRSCFNSLYACATLGGDRFLWQVCKLMITFYWQWVPQKGFAKSKITAAPREPICQVFFEYLSRISALFGQSGSGKSWYNQINPWMWTLPKVENSRFNLLVRIKGMRRRQTRRGSQARSIAFWDSTVLQIQIQMKIQIQICSSMSLNYFEALELEQQSGRKFVDGPNQ